MESLVEFLVHPADHKSLQQSCRRLENYICGSGPVLEALSIFCGRDLSGETWYWTFYTPTPIAAWVVCSLWGLYCMFKHTTSSGSFKGWNMKYRRFWPRFLTPKICNSICWALFVMTWGLGFGYQLYAYVSYFQVSEVNKAWSFGQIIAITVWAPFSAEYVNLEISKHRPLPFPLLNS